MARLTELQPDGSIVLGEGVVVESDGSAVRVKRGTASFTAWPDSPYAAELLAAARRQGVPVERVAAIRSGFELPDGTWVNELDDGTTFTDREAWMHVPDLVARARTLAGGNIAAKNLRHILIDSWCEPVAGWLTKRLTRG